MRDHIDNVLKAAQILKIEGLVRTEAEPTPSHRRKSKPRFRFMQSTKPTCSTINNSIVNSVVSTPAIPPALTASTALQKQRYF